MSGIAANDGSATITRLAKIILRTMAGLRLRPLKI